MTQSRNKGQAARQERILKAIDDGAKSIRDITKAAALSSTSVAAYNVLQLAIRGDIMLEDSSRGLVVADWAGFAAGWDAYAALCGNDGSEDTAVLA